MEPIDRITFKAFIAPEEPELCAEFLREHRRVLEDFGITNVTTNTADWTTDPDTYVIAAISETQGMVGGIRVEVDKEERALPIKNALLKLDPSIQMKLERLRFTGNGEVCGLWNANRYASHGLPFLLSSAAVSIANQIGLKSMVCLVAHYTLRHALKVGFTIMEDLGDGGTFTYPIPTIKAIAMVIPNAITLDNVTFPFRNQLLSLRLRPEQNRLEILNGDPTMLNYQLRIKSIPIDLWPYKSIEGNHSNYGETG